VRQLTQAGCKKVFGEVTSGAKTDRSQLRCALDQLDAGDVLIVTRLDCLARSTFDPFAIVKRLADPGDQFRPSAEQWADTATSTGRLMLPVIVRLTNVAIDDAA